MINRPLPKSSDAMDCKLEGREGACLVRVKYSHFGNNIHAWLLLNIPLCSAGKADVPPHGGPRGIKDPQPEGSWSIGEKRLR